MFEVITFGGGETYRDVFIGVALMSGTGGMASLIRLGLMIGLLLGILRMMGDLNPGRVVKWFVIAAVIYGGLFLPKVTVQITDKYNAALPGATVANVPLGVAFAEATASQIGARVIEMTETAFGSPTDVQYSKTGMIYGAKFMETATRLQFHDQVFTQNLDSFFKNCVWYDLLDNQYTADQLAKSNDLWAFFAEPANAPNPARSGPYVTGPGPVEIKTCPDIFTSLNAAVTGQTQATVRAMERRLRPGIPDASLLASALSEMGTLVGLTNVASTDAQRSLAQIATLNQLKASLGSSSVSSGATSALATAQAQLQTQNTGHILGKVGENAIVVLKIVVDCLFIGMFPILFPCFLLPGMGPKMLQGYVAGFFYLQLWGPMYVIVHQIIMSTSYVQTGAAGALPGAAANGFNLQTIDGINSVNANIQTVAGMMILMIPVLAAALTKGAMAVGGQAEALLAPFRSGAEAAAAAQTTGNFSYGNTSVDTRAYHNVSANRVANSGYIDTGFMTSRNARGDEYTTDRSGALVGVRAAPAEAAVSMERLQERSAQASERARLATERVNAMDHVAARAVAESDQTVRESLFTRSSGSESRTGLSNESRDSRSTGATYLTGVRDEMMNRFGVDFGFAANQTFQATKGVQDTFGVNTGLGAGGGGRVGAQAGINHSTQLTGVTSRLASEGNTANEQKALQWLRQQSQSSDFKTAVDKVTTEALNKSYASYAGSSTTFSDKSAQTWSSTQSFTDSQRQARSDSASLERSADISERTAEILRGDHRAAFQAFANDYLRDIPGGFSRGPDEIARILQGRSETDRELLYDAADAYAARRMHGVEEPGLVQDARAELGSPKEADDLTAPRDVEMSPVSGPRRGGPAPQAGSGPEDLRRPSEDRELRPDPELLDVQQRLNPQVDEALSRRAKRAKE